MNEQPPPARSGLARYGRRLTLGVILAMVMICIWHWKHGHPVLGAVAPLALATGYGLVMALEFALAATVTAVAVGQPPSPTLIIRAWLAETVMAAVVFCWQMPFRSHRWPDLERPAQAPLCRGVLLVHGFLCNRGVWNRWMERLSAMGIPFVAVNLEPVFGAIDDYAQSIERAVVQLETMTGMAPVVVAHSMGGLAVRCWWTDRPGEDPIVDTPHARRLHALITIGSPHQGTWMGRFGFSRNARQMRMDSSWLVRLLAREPEAHRQKTICFYSACDNVVFPLRCATLPAASNKEIVGAAHLQMLHHPAPFEALLAALRDQTDQEQKSDLDQPP